MIGNQREVFLGAIAVMLSTAAFGSPINRSELRVFLDNRSQTQGVFRENPKALVDQVWEFINEYYVDGTFNNVNWQAVRKEYLNRSYTNREDAYKAINQMLNKLKDPYTYFMDPAEFKQAKSERDGELTGIGIQIAQDEKTKQLTVIAPIEDTPAFSAGILAKDTIVKIDGKSTKGMDVNQAVSLIRGQPGTQVQITILRNGQQKDFRIKRARIEVHPVRYSYQNSPTGGVGYISLKEFSSKAPTEMRKAIINLEKKQVAGYILDLRNNPGGFMVASVEIAQMWLDDGVIVSTKYRQGTQDIERSSHRPLTSKPLVVLVNGGSASASEILSGALQDNKRAVLVGEKTFGKGLVQAFIDLDLKDSSKDGGLNYTVAKYFTPNGRDINHVGIAPNVVVPLTDKEKKALFLQNRDKVGTPSDPQYAKALDILQKQIAAKRNSFAK